MATAATNPKQEAHELIERLSTGRVIAAVGLFRAMLDPVSVALPNAPIDDEPVREKEARAVAASEAWLAEHPGKGIPQEELLAEFGINPEDLHR